MAEKNSAAIPVQEIVSRHLKMHGFDGLYATDGDDCGCFLGDLAPCECFGPGCVPGYAAPDPHGNGQIIQAEKPVEAIHASTEAEWVDLGRPEAQR